jgi:hypothetical protein
MTKIDLYHRVSERVLLWWTAAAAVVVRHAHNLTVVLQRAERILNGSAEGPQGATDGRVW